MIVLNTVQLHPVLTTVTGQGAIISFAIGHHSVTLTQGPDRCIDHPNAVKEITRAP